MSEELEKLEATPEVPQGELYVSLARTNAQIRQERGNAIAEDMELRYRRSIEDMELDIKRKERERTNMYDFSPNSTTSLVLAKNVDAKEIQEKDDALTFELRDIRIKLELKKERFKTLFGKDYK